MNLFAPLLLATLQLANGFNFQLGNPQGFGDGPTPAVAVVSKSIVEERAATPFVSQLSQGGFAHQVDSSLVQTPFLSGSQYFGSQPLQQFGSTQFGQIGQQYLPPTHVPVGPTQFPHNEVINRFDDNTFGGDLDIFTASSNVVIQTAVSEALSKVGFNQTIVSNAEFIEPIVRCVRKLHVNLNNKKIDFEYLDGFFDGLLRNNADYAAVTQIQPIIERFSVLLNKPIAQVAQDWQTFKVKYNKQYTPQEDPIRQAVWLVKNYQIKQSNLINQHVLAENDYADWTGKDFGRVMLGTRVNKSVQKHPSVYIPDKGTAPKSFDWREQNAVTPVKSQGQCPNCYAFAAVGALEGQYARKYKELIDLSEQHIVDCLVPNAKYNGQTCGETNDVATVYEYIKKATGIQLEQDYPYEEKANTCRFRQPLAKVFVTGFTQIEEGDEKHLEQMLSFRGPVAVSVYFPATLISYKSGIYKNDAECTNKGVTEVNHSALLVGFGEDENGQKYWTLKNSFGTEWGENGYFRLARERNNHCGIASFAVLPQLALRNQPGA